MKAMHAVKLGETYGENWDKLWLKCEGFICERVM